MEKDLTKLSEKAAWVSIAAYIALSILKLLAGSIAHSKALTADGLNNGTDILASVAVLIGLRLSRKPADSDHPYGHRRAETIASLVASFIMMAVGLEVFANAGTVLWTGQAEKPDWKAAGVSLFCAVVMYLVYRFNLAVAKKTGSHAVMAAAKDNRSDAWVSMGAAIGIAGAQIQLAWLDPAAAVIVGIMICKTAWDIFREATHKLTDGIDADLLSRLGRSIEEVNGVKRIADLKGRFHGNEILVDVDIKVNPQLNVAESHSITEEIEEKVRKEFNIMHVQVHVEPDELEIR
ncbi:cation diffusion facilitator family transporter [Lihuaxuella thermophila]|uniref:Cation diffusion facilitator family transporter n=1 Tax=Lihuaxuella thermophila TaxID=1173111 RepID=A0A1H8ICC8_9BACL|nr:cation diffusion facilitator family transporter [Lihuaxuella thermophila]SEN66104.1 cation diffusion facilitator family transporter [Lihuaxuella thermophila]